MRAPGRILRLLAIAAAIVGLSLASAADDVRFKVIVHPDNPSDVVSRDFLRDAYLKKQSEWHGHALRPIDLSTRHPEREKFTRDVIRKSLAQLRAYWNQQVFSGKAVPPPETDSPSAVVRYVLAHPGAVGYIPADADSGDAKIIAVR